MTDPLSAVTTSHSETQCRRAIFRHTRAVQAKLLIEDDGQGFDPSVRPTDSGALGLISMRERAALARCELGD